MRNYAWVLTINNPDLHINSLLYLGISVLIALRGAFGLGAAHPDKGAVIGVANSPEPLWHMRSSTPEMRRGTI
jgi:hypothetical protein